MSQRDPKAVGNIFAALPDASTDERVSGILSRSGVRVERIVSLGQASPADFWYDQEDGEWVLLLAGEARLAFEDREVQLHPGDYIDIAPHEKHRVAWTHPALETVWLVVFYGVAGSEPSA